MDSWSLPDPSEGLSLTIEPTGICLRSQLGPDPDVLFGAKAKTRLGKLLPNLIPQLTELGLATIHDNAVTISHAAFSDLEDYGIDGFDGIVQWSPFTVEVESSGALGLESFRYTYRFFDGSQPTYPERMGCFVRRGQKIHRLDKTTFSLLEAVDAFNIMPGEAKRGRSAYIRFADVKGLSAELGSQVDKFIENHRVLIPSQVALDMVVGENGRISFIPKFDGADSDAVREAFFERDDVDQIYSFSQEDGSRVHVVLNDAQREVVRRMQRVRKLGGTERDHVLRNPFAVFDGVCEAVDLSLFGPRVKGIGDFPFISQPYLERDTGIFDSESSGETTHPTRRQLKAGIDCEYVDGRRERVTFDSREQIQKLREQARRALHDGIGSVEFKGKSIVADQSFVRALDEMVTALLPQPRKDLQEERGALQRRYLLIYTNQDGLEYQEDEAYEGEGGESDLVIPTALVSGDVLKANQRTGVAWLQRNLKLTLRRGCLLADDMGLGKTLQVLTFLGALIENEFPQVGPYNPILIIAPVILLENETWVNDMRRFFTHNGAIFEPFLVLHGSRIKDFRTDKDRETVVSRPVLDLDGLCEYRLILTNYETVVNYQFSFARLKDRISVVVTDEAQEHKTPNTKTSHALKSLSPKFRVACTGTPVETRLLDVWNIFDFLQPGLLGSATEFRDMFEKPLDSDSDEEHPRSLDLLKKKLKLNAPDAYLLRREKTSLPDLPEKLEHIVESLLSDEQRSHHLDLIAQVRLGGEENHPFRILHHLMKLYQHPALIPKYEAPDIPESLRRGPKLRSVVECLHSIKIRNEKVLIFTRSIDMQQLLASVIASEFAISCDIINGASKRAGNTERSQGTRKEMVARFRRRLGFNVLILNPDVAGMGLTLVEANHVIHYGRWWNPAKESQATDRVYRIGQEKEVHVYFPISRDPKGEFETFDEKLDRLIRRRKELAKEFLTPMPTEVLLERELIEDVGNPPVSAEKQAKLLSADMIRLMSWERFEALAALLEKKEGRQVILTPKSGDGEIDILAFVGREVRLIQCKHTLWDAQVDHDSII